jgi:hypothetical protein
MRKKGKIPVDSQKNLHFLAIFKKSQKKEPEAKTSKDQKKFGY